MQNRRIPVLVVAVGLVAAATAVAYLIRTEPPAEGAPRDHDVLVAGERDVGSRERPQPAAGASGEAAASTEDDCDCPGVSRTPAPALAYGQYRREECRGRIVDGEGRPLSGVSVIVFEPARYGPGGKIVAEAVTLEDGSYAMSVPGSDKLRIAASIDGHADTREALFDRSLRDRDFVLPRLN